LSFTDTLLSDFSTLSLHDALPISVVPRDPTPPTAGRDNRRATRPDAPVVRGRPCSPRERPGAPRRPWPGHQPRRRRWPTPVPARSEEHTSELQSRENLVCRLLLEK